MAFDLLADRFHRGMRAQEPVGQRFVFTQQAKQQVLSLNVRRAKLTGLVPRKEDDASRFLRVAFKHCSLPEDPRGHYAAKSKPTVLRIRKKETTPIIG